MRTQKYIPINPEKFLNHSKIPCDVYIKLGQRKFVKIIKENIEYNKDVILKYQNVDPPVFHVTENGFKALNNFESNLLKKLNNVKNLPFEDQAKKNLWSVQLMQEQMRSIGVSDNVIETSEAIIKDSIENLRKETGLKKLIDAILRKNDYVVEHSLMITYIAMEVCQKLHWNNDATYQKIALASLIHDCLLTDPVHAQLTSKEMIDQAPISAGDKKLILKHPEETAKIVQQATRFIPDVDKIILEHHEQPDGSGFPFGITSTKISPLSCLFIMTEKFVDKLYLNKLNSAIVRELKVEYEKTFNVGNFRKVNEGFESFFDSYLKLQQNSIPI